MGADEPKLHPPKPTLTFRVGIVGHRPNRLPDDLDPLRLVVREILSSITASVQAFQIGQPDLYDSTPPVFQIVSPLAEGADRLVADEGLSLGFGLQSPMPFPQEVYEKDFTFDSLTEFRALLSKAETRGALVRFECDGDRADEAAAYGAAGRVVVNNSDVLLVVWDGGPAQGQGGTLDRLWEAVRCRVPVVRIDPARPDAWRLIRDQAGLDYAPERERGPSGVIAQDARQSIACLIEDILRPPDSSRSGEANGAPRFGARAAYFGESKPGWNPAIVWKVFRDLLGEGRIRWPSINVDLDENGDDWPRGPEAVSRWADGALGVHYAWADRLADLYADKYRSAFVSAFLLAGIAVVVALVPLVPEAYLGNWLASHLRSPGFALVEPFVIAFIFLVLLRSWRKRWHTRWIDYRLVAELVRELRFLLPLGGVRPRPRSSPHLASYEHPEQTWMYWHVRAIEREVGLPVARLDPAYLGQALRHAKLVLRSQRAFHSTNAIRSRRIAHRLHLSGVILFGATFILCLAHVGVRVWSAHASGSDCAEPPLDVLLPVVCAILPALGAALAGINNQGEFGRVTKRSDAMARRLEEIEKRSDKLLEDSPALRSKDVIALAGELAQLMVDEVLDWRVVFKDRPPVLPA